MCVCVFLIKGLRADALIPLIKKVKHAKNSVFKFVSRALVRQTLFRAKGVTRLYYLFTCIFMYEYVLIICMCYYSVLIYHCI